jgi:myo-inositol 2-dehydrogenase/D-chiro-inositol 1-dehydrogenase
VLDDKGLPFELSGAVSAAKIGAALQEALRTGVKLEFNEVGERVSIAKL